MFGNSSSRYALLLAKHIIKEAANRENFQLPTFTIPSLTQTSITITKQHYLYHEAMKKEKLHTISTPLNSPMMFSTTALTNKRDEGTPLKRDSFSLTLEDD